MSSPSLNVVTGSVIATGSAMDVRTVGFRPKTVDLRTGATGGIEGHWQAGMADASAYKRTAAGVGSKVTANGITPLADGFRIGADSDLNSAGKQIDYVVGCE